MKVVNDNFPHTSKFDMVYSRSNCVSRNCFMISKKNLHCIVSNKEQFSKKVEMHVICYVSDKNTKITITIT